MKIVNYEIISKNISNILKSNRLYAVLKNDAYGFNIDKILKILEEKKLDGYFVNTIEEAIDLRKKTKRNIYLMGKYLYDISLLKKYNIIPTASTISEISLFSGNNLKYSIKLNVGMNRFGTNEIDENLIKDNNFVLLYAHFPLYNEKTNEIINKINDLASKYNKEYCVGGSILYGKTLAPLRLGYQMYKDSLFFYGRIIGLRYISKNDSVGYNMEYIANKRQKIAILDVGYYNGIRVGFNGYVYYKENKYNIIGRVCMNHIFIIAADDMKIGEYVEIISENIKMEEFIKYNKCTEYEAFLTIK